MPMGYWTPQGYRGYVESYGRYILFASQKEYFEYLEAANE